MALQQSHTQDEHVGQSLPLFLGKVDLEKPLHLVIGSVSPTSVVLSWGTLLKTSYQGNIMNDCLEDGWDQLWPFFFKFNFSIWQINPINGKLVIGLVHRCCRKEYHFFTSRILAAGFGKQTNRWWTENVLPHRHIHGHTDWSNGKKTQLF